MTDTDIAIVGAGPHGLSAAAHLRRSGAEVRVLGQPMSFWQTMPVGMLLRSNWTATCIAEYQGPLSLDSFLAATGSRLKRPIPLERFIEYGLWVQEQAVPDVDRRLVETLGRDGDGFELRFADGSALTARRVVVAAGIAPFANRAAIAAQLPPEEMKEFDTPFTPAHTLILALRASLKRIRAEGIENIWQRHRRMSEACQAGIQALGLELFSARPAEGLTAFRVPEGLKDTDIRNPLYERFKNRSVFKRFGEPSDIAAAIGFLCSEEAGYITGAALEVAGGIPLFTA